MTKDNDHNEFEQQESDPSLLAEFCEFLLENKKFWLIPILVVLLLLAVLVVFAPASPMAPFIYTLF